LIKKFELLSGIYSSVGMYYLGNLNSSSNIVDMKILSRRSYKKVGHDQRCFRLYALIGGRKDINNDKSYDAPSKVC
jgi:hypothetical protein